MGKTIIIDAKLLNKQTKEFSRSNILLAGQKILGLGYVPDDDDIKADLLNVNGSFVLPFLSHYYPLDEKSKPLYIKNGITNALDYEELLCNKSGENLKEALEKAEKSQTPLYCILQNLQEDLTIYKAAKKNNEFLAAGIPLDILEKEDISKLEALTQNGIIQTIVCEKDSCEAFLERAIAYLHPTFQMSDILTLLCFNPFFIAGEKAPEFTLLSSPNFCIVDPKKSPILQCVIFQGNVVVDNTK